MRGVVTLAAPEAPAAVALFGLEGINGDDGEVPQELGPGTNSGRIEDLGSRKARTLRQERPTWRIPVTSYAASTVVTCEQREGQLHDEKRSGGNQPAYMSMIYRRFQPLLPRRTGQSSKGATKG